MMKAFGKNYRTSMRTVKEWWLVTPYMAELLKEKGEVILSDYGCYWWGRTTSGQALYMDGVIQEIAGQI